MPLRPGRCYRHFGTPPYTRLEYIKGAPPVHIPKFDLGNVKGDFSVIVELIAEESGQIRANAIEAARIISHKYLAKRLGQTQYHLKICIYPHHILRENKMMAVAGADRLQDGMRLAFGTPIGRAARIKEGQRLMLVRVNPEGIDVAKEALKRASSKFPMPARIVVKYVSGKS